VARREVVNNPVRPGERAPDILICTAARLPKLARAAAPNGGDARHPAFRATTGGRGLLWASYRCGILRWASGSWSMWMRRQLSQLRELEAGDAPKAFGVHEQLWHDNHLGVVLEPGKDSSGRCRRSHDAGITNGGVALRVPAGDLGIGGPRDARITRSRQLSPVDQEVLGRLRQAVGDVPGPAEQRDELRCKVSPLRCPEAGPDETQTAVELTGWQNRAGSQQPGELLIWRRAQIAAGQPG